MLDQLNSNSFYYFLSVTCRALNSSFMVYSSASDWIHFTESRVQGKREVKENGGIDQSSFIARRDRGRGKGMIYTHREEGRQ